MEWPEIVSKIQQDLKDIIEVSSLSRKFRFVQTKAYVQLKNKFLIELEFSDTDHIANYSNLKCIVRDENKNILTKEFLSLGKYTLQFNKNTYVGWNESGSFGKNCNSIPYDLKISISNDITTIISIYENDF